MSSDEELLLLSYDSTKRCHWLQHFGLLNIFEHVWKRAIIACNNCSALHAINCTCNHGLRWQTKHISLTTNVLLLLTLHSSSTSNANSTLILGCILILFSFTTGHLCTSTHVCTHAKKVITFHFNSWLSCQRLCGLLLGSALIKLVKHFLLYSSLTPI